MTPRTAEILRRRAAGDSTRQIAQAFGITRSRVYQILIRHSRRAAHPLAALSTRAQHVLARPYNHWWSPRQLLFPPITTPDQLAASTFDLATLRQIPGCGIKTAREILAARDALQPISPVTTP